MILCHVVVVGVTISSCPARCASSSSAGFEAFNTQVELGEGRGAGARADAQGARLRPLRAAGALVDVPHLRDARLPVQAPQPVPRAFAIRLRLPRLRARVRVVTPHDTSSAGSRQSPCSHMYTDVLSCDMYTDPSLK